MNTLIHPSAIISNKAQIGNNTTIGPFTIVEDNVIIGDDCIIGPNVGIYEGARIGKRVKIYQGASISNHPQDLKFANEESIFEVGDDTVIREFATLHRGTKETKISKVGKNCLLMAYSHVAHDCMVGDNCILANSVQLGGHVEIGDWVIIGGGSMVHQFGKVGMHAMIGGGYRAVVDVPPFVLTAGDPLKFEGLNTIGLRRRGFTNDDIYKLKNIYQIIFSGDLNLTQAKQKIREDFKDDNLANAVLEFLGKSTRGIIKK
ncbi:MAG: acyl-ACP--UDP-N-acetylglucosamine O-acyltransferase [Ignavibacteriae bacterium]|nr:acyl-ACP--UDP-N-acetylglucosamine O-acyltransferase [Ignavibacteriota bacterium]